MSDVFLVCVVCIGTPDFIVSSAATYPSTYLAGIPAKMTVSELKKAGADEPGLQLYAEPDIIPYIPQFMKQVREEAEGAARGTIYHRVLECLDYGQVVRS